MGTPDFAVVLSPKALEGPHSFLAFPIDPNHDKTQVSLGNWILTFNDRWQA